jgi:large subunit ribosomal protein L5
MRDFQGLDPSGFDKHGNYNLALKEQLIFPEIDFDQVDQIRGLNLTFVTSAKKSRRRLCIIERIWHAFSNLIYIIKNYGN